MTKESWRIRIVALFACPGERRTKPVGSLSVLPWTLWCKRMVNHHRIRSYPRPFIFHGAMVICRGIASKSIPKFDIPTERTPT